MAHPKLTRKGTASPSQRLWRPWESQYRQKCPYGDCQKLFTRKDNLLRHMKGKHGGSRQAKPCCSFCHKPLSRPDAVLRHEATCPERRFANFDDNTTASSPQSSSFNRSASSSPLQLLPLLLDPAEEPQDLSPRRRFSVIVVAPHSHQLRYDRSPSSSTIATSASEMDVDSQEDSLSSV